MHIETRDQARARERERERKSRERQTATYRDELQEGRERKRDVQREGEKAR